MKVGDSMKLDGEIVCANFDFNRGRRWVGTKRLLAIYYLSWRFYPPLNVSTPIKPL